jgi:hypothetical protein
LQAIQRGKYRVIVTNPEILMANDEMQKLFKVSKFTRRIYFTLVDCFEPVSDIVNAIQTIAGVGQPQLQTTFLD